MSIFQQVEYKGETLLNTKDLSPLIKKILRIFINDFEVCQNDELGTFLRVKVPKGVEEQIITLVKSSDYIYEESYRTFMDKIAEQEKNLFNKFTIERVTRQYKGETYRGMILVYQEKGHR